MMTWLPTVSSMGGMVGGLGGCWSGRAPAGVAMVPATRWSTWRGTALQLGTTTSSQTTAVPELGIGSSAADPASADVPMGFSCVDSRAPVSDRTTWLVSASRTSTVSRSTSNAVALVSTSSSATWERPSDAFTACGVVSTCDVTGVNCVVGMMPGAFEFDAALPATTSVLASIVHTTAAAARLIPLIAPPEGRTLTRPPPPGLGERDIAVAVAAGLVDVELEEDVPLGRCVARHRDGDLARVGVGDEYRLAGHPELATRPAAVGHAVVHR